MTNFEYIKRRFSKYMRRTYKNKLVAIALPIMGIVSAKLTQDASLFVLGTLLFVPLFFMNKDCFHN
jgi:hypothetical protein